MITSQSQLFQQIKKKNRKILSNNQKSKQQFPLDSPS